MEWYAWIMFYNSYHEQARIFKTTPPKTIPAIFFYSEEIFRSQMESKYFRRFHHDPSPQRNAKRRGQTCLDGKKRVDPLEGTVLGQDRYPESNQPATWKSAGNPQGTTAETFVESNG